MGLCWVNDIEERLTTWGFNVLRTIFLMKLSEIFRIATLEDLPDLETRPECPEEGAGNVTDRGEVSLTNDDEQENKNS